MKWLEWHTICSGWRSEEYNHALGAFIFATAEELQDFLDDHARHNLEHRISWHDVMKPTGPLGKGASIEYLRSPEWKQKRQAVLNRAMQPFVVEPINPSDAR